MEKLTQQKMEEGTGDGAEMVCHDSNVNKSLTTGAGVGAEQFGRNSSMKRSSKRVAVSCGTDVVLR